MILVSDIYAENQLLYSFDIDSTQKQQVWIDDGVIEWSEVELSTQEVYGIIQIKFRPQHR